VICSAREKTGAHMRDKATIKRLQMYRKGGKVVRSVLNYFVYSSWTVADQHLLYDCLHHSQAFIQW